MVPWPLYDLQYELTFSETFSFGYDPPKIWNDLFDDVRSATSLQRSSVA